jgi:hypothetical protein
MAKELASLNATADHIQSLNLHMAKELASLNTTVDHMQSLKLHMSKELASLNTTVDHMQSLNLHMAKEKMWDTSEVLVARQSFHVPLWARVTCYTGWTTTTKRYKLKTDDKKSSI